MERGMFKKDEWLETYVQGKTFADVGGIWNTINEKVTLAAEFGAKEVTMIDIHVKDSIWWKAFEDRCAEKGVISTNIVANIDTYKTNKTYDVIHCSGVLYHCYKPEKTLKKLHKLVNEVLILSSTRIPDGMCGVEVGKRLAVKDMTEEQYDEYENFFKFGFKTLNKGDKFNPKDYVPWHYLFTDENIKTMVINAGFEIMEEDYYWDNKCLALLLRKA